MAVALLQSKPDAAWEGLADCRSCEVRDRVLFCDLLEPDLDLLHQPIVEILFDAGSLLYGEGDTGHWVFSVRSGLIKLVQALPEGSQRIVRLLRPGAADGLEATLGRLYEHSAIALNATLVCRIPVNTIRDLNSETPRLHRQLMARWHQSVHDADAWLTRLSTGSARTRLARLLLSLPTGPRGECEFFGIDDLGAMLGITPETASRVMADLKRSAAVTPVSGNLYRRNARVLEGVLSNSR